MSKPQPRLEIVIASTRPGRVGPAIASWFERRARAHAGFDVGILDLAEVALPFLDEPESPRLRNYSKPHTKAWSAKIDAADAFAFVMPEYNHGFNAPLKNAIDYLNFEWRHKPVGFVSYGGPAAGTRAVLMLEPVLTALRMTPVAEAVNVAWVNKLVTVEGVFQPTETLERGAGAMLDALARTERVLRALRESV